MPAAAGDFLISSIFSTAATGNEILHLSSSTLTNAHRHWYLSCFRKLIFTAPCSSVQARSSDQSRNYFYLIWLLKTWRNSLITTQSMFLSNVCIMHHCLWFTCILAMVGFWHFLSFSARVLFFITFTFMHLADAFIQGNLQKRKYLMLWFYACMLCAVSCNAKRKNLL